jgi:hypothetical protein
MSVRKKIGYSDVGQTNAQSVLYFSPVGFDNRGFRELRPVYMFIFKSKAKVTGPNEGI